MHAELIPESLLIASEPFGPRLSAAQVAAALARGLAGGGRPQVDRCHLSADPEPTRLRANRAVVIAAARLDERTLAGSPAFEIATRARQAGVPAYAVSADDQLSAFDARVLDLQLVLQARDSRSLAAAGRRIALLA